MSKAIKWQIPFASLSGTLYRLDIYAEGYTGDPIQLTAGETPFVTDEDSSEDFFAPIRTQSGSIQVCTRKPDGTMLTLDEILPANNIDHPVLLINLSSSNAIEWQGFLSCEAYSQNYTSIPENLTLSVISVLEAMDSVHLGASTEGLVTIAALLNTALTQINSSVLMSFFTDIYYSQASWDILNQSIDKQWFYDEDEIQTSESLSYILAGVSTKEVLKRLCKFMGWTARESGTAIYFERIGEEVGMFHETMANFGSNFHTTYDTMSLTDIDIADFDWRGTDHKRDLRQGAKRVEVVAKLNKISDIDLDLPDFPFSNPTSAFGLSILKPDNNVLVTQYPWMTAEQNDAYYPHCGYNYLYGVLDTTQTPIRSTLSGDSTQADFLSHIYLRHGHITDTTRYPGACLVNFSIVRNQFDFEKYQRGLYCAFLPNLLTAYPKPIFTMKTTTVHSSGVGVRSRLIVKGKMIFIGYNTANSRVIMTNKIDDEFLNIKYARFAPIVRWGNKYYSSGWQTWSGYDSASGADGNLVGDGFEIHIPVISGLSGNIEIGLKPTYSIDSRDTNILYEAIFTELSISLEQSEDVVWKNASENKYIQVLSTNFRDEINISTEIASNNNNHTQEVLPFSTIEYTKADTTTESRRPEVDLLNRLASYYGAARQTLDLTVKHPVVNNQQAVLPLLKLNGIGDGKQYLPLSESRDWREETCTIKCFETI